MTYLNHAGTSWPKPEPVRAAVARALSGSPSDWNASFEAAHERVARGLGIERAERLLITPGCTSALALAVNDHVWARGDRLLVSGLEHHALYRPVTGLREQGVEIGIVPRGEDEPLDLEILERELRGGRVRLVAMTAACNVTGELLDVGRVVALAHRHGALCLIDGAQVCGWMPVDVGELGADLFAFAGHKGLQAPWGIGGLYVAPGVSMSSSSATCELPPAGGAPACSTMPGYCDAGSVDRAALAGLAAALDWLDARPRTNRLERARSLVEELARALEERSGVRLLGVRDPLSRLPTIAFTHERRNMSEIAEAFSRRDVTVGAGLLCAPLAHESLGTARTGVVRLSAGPCSTEEDVERALAVVATL